MFTASEKRTGMCVLHDRNIICSWCWSGSGKLFQLGQSCDPLSLMLSWLLLWSYCLGVVKRKRRRRVRSCCTGMPGIHPTQTEEMLLLFFLFPSCDHAQSSLHYFSGGLSKSLICDSFLLPVTVTKLKWLQMCKERVTIARNTKLISHYLDSTEGMNTKYGFFQNHRCNHWTL